jgi:pyruvate/2-oxoglutarate dehydrogenase complex dihydrolipoamide dehydrogenase (E3) component
MDREEGLPPIAAVGLSEGAARQQTPRLKVNSAKVSDWYTARRVGESVYGYKTLVEKESGRILGAHLVGPHADEVINLFGVAIRHAPLAVGQGEASWPTAQPKPLATGSPALPAIC